MSSESPALCSVEFDYRDPAFQADPYPVYAQLREHEPIAYREEGPDRSFWLTRHQHALALLRDPRFSAAREIGGLQEPSVPLKFQRLGQMLGRMMLNNDEPDHMRLRGLVNKAFTPRVVERLRPRIASIVDGLLGAVMTRGRRRMDVIQDLATPLPVMVIAELLGIPVSDQGKFKIWSDDIAVVLDGSVRPAGLPKAADSAGELSDYLRSVIAQRRRQPREDLISRMIGARDRNDALSDDEMVSNCILLLLAGHETTTNLIGNGALALLRHPDQLKQLREQPELAPAAVEECLRYDAPVQLTSREPFEDVELFGTKFPKGIEIDVIIGSANRDPARFQDADRFDIGRRESGHLAFGHGSHFCIGAPLARLEGEIALGRLAARLPALALDTEEPTWRPGLVLRGLQALPVSF
jgi:cytochrome P450